MFKHLFILCLFGLALQIEASTEDDFKTRKVWVGELKSFLLELEAKNPEFLTTSTGQNFLKKFSLIQDAMAAGPYECFYAGWPSSLIKSGGKKLCQNPASGNSEYQKGECGNGQLQCQPLMFGKGVCVGFSSQKEKQLAFSSCENKFKQKGNYDFLKALSPEEKAALKEISLLANDICISGSVGIQKSKPMCKSLISKLDNSMQAIERAPAEEKSDETPVIVKKEDVKEEEKVEIPEVDVPTIDIPKEVKVKNEDAEEELIPVVINPPNKKEESCEEIVIDKKVIDEANAIIKTVNTNSDSVYEEIKKEFLSSAFCAPEMVLNNPKDKLSPVLFKQLLDDMQFIVKTDSYLTRDVKLARFKELAQDYELGEETIAYGTEMIKNMAETSDGRFQVMARVRGVMLQEMEKLSKTKPGYQDESIRDELLDRGIFTEDADGVPQCPFVSEDAFRNALAGREAVLKSAHKSKIKDPDVLTIVDYSRPSNERRMFVIDIKTKKVLHNTWVGHGGGKDRSQEMGTDKKGSSPQTGDAAGSLLSSEGFYIAKAASSGDRYLNNVTLEGIDQNNKSMGSRAIVVHGWRTPNHEYVNKTWVMSEEKNYKRLPGKDIYREFMDTDFKTTQVDLFNLTQDVKSAASGKEFIDATDGCLGVPDTKMGHTDRKGRDKSQLELLRDDLPGTLMFNYTGPGKTKSQYLR